MGFLLYQCEARWVHTVRRGLRPSTAQTGNASLPERSTSAAKPAVILEDSALWAEWHLLKAIVRTFRHSRASGNPGGL